MKIGIGYDIHRLVRERELIIGGVTISNEKGLLGHSDADVLIHAVIDAILGAVSEGDIGSKFPDTDPSYKDISSVDLLVEVVSLAKEKGYTVNNIDSTVMIEDPEIGPYREKMIDVLAIALRIKTLTE